MYNKYVIWDYNKIRYISINRRIVMNLYIRAIGFQYLDADFEEEMIVMLLADNQTLDKLLFQMRKEKVQIPLKAIVTAKNQNWTSTALYKEVKREHESMTKAEQAGKKKEE